MKEHKEEKEHTRLAVGGDQVELPGDKSTRTSGLTIAKIIINSTTSTKGAILLAIDIKTNNVNTQLRRCTCMTINLTLLPQEVIVENNLLDLAHDGRVYIEIHKGMYGLPQSGILENELSQQRLSLDVYHPIEHTHGIWKHEI
jgi:hypothetical protein